MPTPPDAGRMGAGAGDLTQILGAIREVEASLERREMRVSGAISVTWGAVAFGIFLFYHLVQQNHDLYHALFGPLVSWMWVPPMLLGYVVTLAIGARAGRVTQDSEAARESRFLALALLAPIALTVAIVAGVVPGVGSLSIPGVWALFLAAMCLRAARRSDGAPRAGGAVVGVVALATGLLLLAFTPDWANLAGAALYALGLGGLGTALYLKGSG